MTRRTSSGFGAISALVFQSIGSRWPLIGCMFGLCGVACAPQNLEPITLGGSWCTANTTVRTQFCRDFDDGQAYGAGWSSSYFNPNNLASLDATDAPPGSAPSSLLLTTPQLASGATAVDQFKQNVSSPGGVVVDLALKVTNFDSQAADLTVVTVYVQGNDTWFVGLDLVGTSIQLTESQAAPGGGAPVQVHHQATLPPLGDWHQVRLSLQVASGATTASLGYDGQTLVSSVALTPPSPPTNYLVNLGIAYLIGPANPMQVRVDNFKIDSPASP